MTDGEARHIRVLIVDDIPETRENLKKLLYFESDIEVIGAAASGEEAVSMARELTPDIVLMDINMPGLDGITASEMITQEVPQAQIIMMSVQGEADYLRRSMLAGAREFLIKPFSTEELVSSIRRVYELGAAKRQLLTQAVAAATGPLGVPAGPPPAPQNLGKVVAVYAPKGGVGCSTIAVNLAVAFKSILPDSKVLLIDAGVQFGGVDVLMNLQAQRTIVDVAQKVTDLDADFINSVVTSHTSGVKVLLAPPRPEMGDLVSASDMEKILAEVKKYYDIIVVDTRNVLHDMELTILDGADRIVLLTTPDIPAIKNVKLFFDVISALEYPEDKVLLVVNQADQRSAIRPEDIEQSLRHPIAGTIPDDERLASIAVNQGVPFVMTHRNSPLAHAVLELAQRLVNELQPAAAPAPAPAAPPRGGTGLLGKFLKPS